MEESTSSATPTSAGVSTPVSSPGSVSAPENVGAVASEPTPPRSFPHPHQEPQEKIYLTVRAYWLAFMPRALIVFFLILLPAIVGMAINIFPSPGVPAGFGTEELTGVPPALLPYLIVGAGIWYLLVLAFFHYTWIDFYMDMAIITDDRLIDIGQHGIFHRAISEVSLLRVQDVNASTKGIFQTIFNFGKVDVETAGELPNFVLENRPHPFEIARVVQNAHERLVRQTAESGQRDGLGEIVRAAPFEPQPTASPPTPIMHEKPQSPWPVTNSADQSSAVKDQAESALPTPNTPSRSVSPDPPNSQAATSSGEEGTIPPVTGR